MLLDINMPRMSGLEMLRAMRSDPGLQMTTVVVLSTSNHDRDLIEAYKLNVAGYLVKPVTLRGVRAAHDLAAPVLDDGGVAMTTRGDEAIRVLVALDDEGERAAIGRHLAAGGVEVLEEQGGGQALVERARAQAYDVIVMGETLHGEAGAALVNRLREAKIGGAIVAIAGDEEGAAALVAAGATDVLAREDIVPARVVRRVQAAHRLARARRRPLRRRGRRPTRRPDGAARSWRLVAARSARAAARDPDRARRPRRRLDPGEKRARYVAATRRAIERANRLIADLMMAAQIEAGTLHVEPGGGAARAARAGPRNDDTDGQQERDAILVRDARTSRRAPIASACCRRSAT